MHKLTQLDARLAELTDVNYHTEARFVACCFAIDNICKGSNFEGVFVRLGGIYKAIMLRQLEGGLSYEDGLLRRGADDEFNIYAPKISEAFHEVTKKYI